jgi:hypothetical protein
MSTYDEKIERVADFLYNRIESAVIMAVEGHGTSDAMRRAMVTNKDILDLLRRELT